MNCEALARDACPCILADIGHCRCCSMLSGKQFCQCDYPGVCVYEKYRWEEKQPLSECDQIVAILPAGSAGGIIIQWSGVSSTQLGDMVTVAQDSQKTVKGVVLQTYPEQNLAYLLLTDRWISLQETQQITVKREYNVFGADAAHFANIAGKSIVILADADLLPLLNVFANGLHAQGAEVQLMHLHAKWPKTEDLFVFISRNMEELSRALKHLPLINTAHSAFWYVS